jgi:outer membrane protein OmpA-like peptidoglycan-associated protein
MKPLPFLLTCAVRLVVLLAVASLTVTAQPLPGGEGGSRFQLGILGGVNYNNVATDMRNFINVAGDPGFAISDFSTSDGIAPFGGVSLQYPSNHLFSAYLRATYDDRSITGTSSGNELDAKLAYISIEPGLRLNILASRLHMLFGASALFNITDQYSYRPVRGEGSIAVTDATVDNINKTMLGVWGGFGYDIRLNPNSNGAVWVLTPFVEASYLFDQFSQPLDGGSEKWNTLTGRGGLALKLEIGPAPVVLSEIGPPPAVTFKVTPPRLGVVEPREVSEQFPLLNYIFFDSGSATMPARYPRLTMTQAKEFDEEALREGIGPGSSRPQTRTAKQLSIYYNAVNIIGVRMMNSPLSQITLVGSAPDLSDARQMAEDVKAYLVATFNIPDDRITTKGQIRPPHASGTRVTPKEDLPLVAVENRRVEILSNNSLLLKPVELRTLIEEPFGNDLRIDVSTRVPVKSWTMRITGRGFDQWYGPFYTPGQRINTTQMLAGASEATLTARLIAVTNDGKSAISEQQFSLSRREIVSARGNRFSILFDFDDSKTVAMYEEFLRNQVVPLIPGGSTIYVHGHTDAIGEEEYNNQLSEERAQGTLDIIVDELIKIGRSPVFYEMYGFGEDARHITFSNDTPEGRYHNRTVVIDVVPGK